MENNNLNIDDIIRDLELDLNSIDIKDEKDVLLNNISANSIITSKNNEELKVELNEELKIEAENQNIITNNIEKEIIVNKNFTIIPKVIFLFKYLITTSIIFCVLLLTTNYSAYLNIINSYVFKEDFENRSKWLISSVKATTIKEKYQDNIHTKKTIIEDDKESIISKNSIKRLINSSDNENLSMDIEITPYTNRIVIPKIWKNIPLVDIKNRKISWEKELNNIFMKELENWVVRYPSSAKPWEKWNAFIFWHSSNFPWIKWDFNAIFALLDKVSYNDEIIVYYNQKKIVYKIKEKK